MNQGSGVRAHLILPEEKTARRIADTLAETFDGEDVAVAVFETPRPDPSRPAPGWELAIYFGHPPDEPAIRALVDMAAGTEAAKALHFAPTEARDWVANSLAGLPPVVAGRFIVHGHHDRAALTANHIGIEIEAALAFGTGHHGTTRGCLLLLAEVLKARRPRRVLDLGSGTGVLAIAAAKVCRRKVLASDIDRQSAIIARENAAANGVPHLIESIEATGFAAPQFAARGPFDLVLANILANPLRALAPEMARHLAPQAIVILSGLLPAQASGVVAAYRAQGLALKRRIVVDGWCSLVMQA